MFDEMVKYTRAHGRNGSLWDMAKLDADTRRNTYLKNASRSASSKRTKKPNRLHVSRRTKAKHRRA